MCREDGGGRDRGWRRCGGCWSAGGWDVRCRGRPTGGDERAGEHAGAECGEPEFGHLESPFSPLETRTFPRDVSLSGRGRTFRNVRHGNVNDVGACAVCVQRLRSGRLLRLGCELSEGGTGRGRVWRADRRSTGCAVGEFCGGCAPCPGVSAPLSI